MPSLSATQQQQRVPLSAAGAAVVSVLPVCLPACFPACLRNKSMHEDLVTDSAHRSKGYGLILLQWLREQATAQECNKLWLVSGAQRVDAHRFYEANGVAKFGFVFMEDV
jgi:GNAT superfamily N-acetyltransferase